MTWWVTTGENVATGDGAMTDGGDDDTVAAGNGEMPGGILNEEQLNARNYR